MTAQHRSGAAPIRLWAVPGAAASLGNTVFFTPLVLGGGCVWETAGIKAALLAEVVLWPWGAGQSLAQFVLPRLAAARTIVKSCL